MAADSGTGDSKSPDAELQRLVKRDESLAVYNRLDSLTGDFIAFGWSFWMAKAIQ